MDEQELQASDVLAIDDAPEQAHAALQTHDHAEADEQPRQPASRHSDKNMPQKRKWSCRYPTNAASPQHNSAYF